MITERYVIDENGYFVENVLYDEESKTIKFYELKSGESLVPICDKSSFIKPKWNGTAWVEAADKKVIEEKNKERVEMIRESKLSEVNYSCRQTIEDGFDLQSSNGETKHYSLTEVDQINIATAHSAVLQGATGYSYHADGEISSWRSAEEITLLTSIASQFKAYQITYSSHLKHWIKRETDLEVLKNIQYGMELPEDLQESMNELLQKS